VTVLGEFEEVVEFDDVTPVDWPDVPVVEDPDVDVVTEA
jgi:hypothetical protein